MAETSNIRTKLAVDNLSMCKLHSEHLTDWELDFILNICENDRVASLTAKEFNKLAQIAQDLRKRGFREMTRV